MYRTVAQESFRRQSVGVCRSELVRCGLRQLGREVTKRKSPTHTSVAKMVHRNQELSVSREMSPPTRNAAPTITNVTKIARCPPSSLDQGLRIPQYPSRSIPTRARLAVRRMARCRMPPVHRALGDRLAGRRKWILASQLRVTLATVW